MILTFATTTIALLWLGAFATFPVAAFYEGR